ncbi:NAD(P)-dependent dehydrogenase (short-subunit alcohol dehydrogenase family) [Azospirillum agricola]|uniref:SDR family NAD(P)-dependent oxidoreductase n=1 Tax=Azospirillum agricola TaxID=1720247 RepID=UPI001AE342BC|nr:SDR family oxidoreductase [Azospirillum agricola]MBP2231833.1 NAD(P)-dependent dehydrogenase (short-subunit alcohol dehydrogenase family) [Azospirillum agricola]
MTQDGALGQNPLAVIIGGGNGIGEATARLMAERGWRVVVADRDPGAAERVAADIGGAAVTLDIADAVAVEAAGAAIEAAHGPVGALVVAAAVFQDVLPPAQLPLEAWERTVHVNLTGTWYANRTFGTRMARHGRGSIINIASIAAIGSVPVHAYASSKAAVVSLTLNLAGEWGRAGVRVNCVSPGSTLVPRVAERIRSGRYAADPAEFTALGRIVQPSEVAETIEFLASERASAITGVNLVVDAGWHVAGTWAQYGGVRPAPERVGSAG